MYKILIADDSVLDMECITYLIQKNNLPLQVFTANDGQAAFKLFEEPGAFYDILLTDIRMPFLDGLELSRRVRRLSPETEIILFSGFEDFEYAQTAIRIGVKDYLMKPVSPADFLSTIRKVTESIAQRRHLQKTQQLQEQMVRSHLLWQSLHSPVPDHALPEYTALVLLDCGDEFFNRPELDFEQRLRELLPLSFDWLNLDPSCSLLFITGDLLREADLLSASQTAVRCAAEEYGQPMYAAFDFLAGRKLSCVFPLLEKRMENRFFFPEQNVIPPVGPERSWSGSGHISMQILKDDLRLRDMDAFQAHLQDIFDSLRRDSNQSLIYVKYCFTELAGTICGAIVQKNRPDFDLLAETIYRGGDILTLEKTIRSLASRLESDHEVQALSRTEKIRQYLMVNYARQISLDELAAHFFLSPNYLCAAFKKENGCSPMKFLNDIRLKKARALLLGSSMKVSTVASAVGFLNTSYFCQRFRDAYGETPENYRLKELS